jgi:pimeloyl-ACP methyl ester carboxylesterase
MAERNAYRARWITPLQKTETPLKLINGIADPISGASIVRRYREIVPTPDITELPQIGHYPHLESPNEVLKNYLTFYEKRFSEKL